MDFTSEDRERPKEFDTDGCKRLCAAIVQSACEDYRFAGVEKRRELEKFFRSDYFQRISDIDHEWLIKNLRETYPIRNLFKMKNGGLM